MANRLNALALLLAAALAAVAMPAQADAIPAEADDVTDLIHVPVPTGIVAGLDALPETDPILDMFNVPDACNANAGVQAALFSSNAFSDTPVSCMQREPVESCDESDLICQITCTTGMDSGFVLVPDVMLPEKVVIGTPVYYKNGDVGTFGHITICLR